MTTVSPVDGADHVIVDDELPLRLDAVAAWLCGQLESRAWR
jgi:hypothetical protein